MAYNNALISYKNTDFCAYLQIIASYFCDMADYLYFCRDLESLSSNYDTSQCFQ